MMITIEKINALSKEKVVDFLKSVPSIDKLDDNILKNAVIALDGEKVVGCIAFEIFGVKGLVRYFVFKKMLETIYLEKLLNRLEQQAIVEKINTLVCIAECDEIEELFKSLGFEVVLEKNIFVNEENVKKTSFKNARFLRKSLID